MKFSMNENMDEPFELNKFLYLHENETNIVDYYYESLLDLSFENSRSAKKYSNDFKKMRTYKTI